MKKLKSYFNHLNVSVLSERDTIKAKHRRAGNGGMVALLKRVGERGMTKTNCVRDPTHLAFSK
jgi:hypothetical protein